MPFVLTTEHYVNYRLASKTRELNKAYRGGRAMRKARLSKGSRVEVSLTVDLTPHTVVWAHERGTIVLHDYETGWTEVRLDKRHKGLDEWDNCMWLVDGSETRAHLTPAPTVGERVAYAVSLVAALMGMSALYVTAGAVAAEQAGLIAAQSWLPF